MEILGQGSMKSQYKGAIIRVTDVHNRCSRILEKLTKVFPELSFQKQGPSSDHLAPILGGLELTLGLLEKTLRQKNRVTGDSILGGQGEGRALST